MKGTKAARRSSHGISRNDNNKHYHDEHYQSDDAEEHAARLLSLLRLHNLLGSLLDLDRALLDVVVDPVQEGALLNYQGTQVPHDLIEGWVKGTCQKDTSAANLGK